MQLYLKTENILNVVEVVQISQFAPPTQAKGGKGIEKIIVNPCVRPTFRPSFCPSVSFLVRLQCCPATPIISLEIVFLWLKSCMLFFYYIFFVSAIFNGLMVHAPSCLYNFSYVFHRIDSKFCIMPFHDTNVCTLTLLSRREVTG